MAAGESGGRGELDFLPSHRDPGSFLLVTLLSSWSLLHSFVMEKENFLLPYPESQISHSLSYFLG